MKRYFTQILPLILLLALITNQASSQCSTAFYGLYPSATFTPVCGASCSYQTITTIGYAGEYSNVNVISGNTYRFRSSNTGDFITIRNSTNTTTYAFGTGGTNGVQWTSTITGTVRMYRHTNSSCGNSSISRTISVCCISGAPSAPANDLVCNATPISCGQTLSGTTIGATSNTLYEVPTLLCGNYQNTPGVWYSFVGNGQTITASLCGTSWDSQISVFSGSCSSLTCIGGADDNGPACGGTSASFSWPSVNGVTYYIKVYGWSTNSAFNLSLSCVTPVVNPCTTIPTITPSCPTSSSVTANMSGSGAWNVTTCGFSTPGQERIYSYTPTTTGVHTLNVTSASGGFVDFFYKAASGGCSSTGWTCIDDIISTGTYTLGSLTAGVTYYILLDPEGTGSYNFTFNVGCPVSNPCTSITTISATCPTTPTYTANMSGAGSWSLTGCWFAGTPGQERIYSYTPTTSGNHILNITSASGGYVDYFWKAASGGCNNSGWNCIIDNNTTGSFSFGPLTAGVTYYLLFDPEGTGSYSHSFNISCPTPPPANDNCSGAIPIACGSSYSGNTALASNDAFPTCGSTGVGLNKGVWHTVNLTASGQITASLVGGATWDTYLRVFSGSCAGLTCVGFNDDFSGLQSQVTTPTLPAGTYYVLVSGYSTSDAGAYSLSVTCVLCTSPPNAGTITGPSLSGTNCSGSTYNFTNTGGSNIIWQVSTTSPSSGYSDVAGATSSNFSYVPTSGGTYYIRTRAAGTGVCADAFSNVYTLSVVNAGGVLTVSPVPANVCPGSTVNLNSVFSVTANSSLTITVSGAGFLDETSWSVTGGFSGGPYTTGSTNTITISPSSYPVVFSIETQGTFNDNVATYSVVCNGTSTVLASGTIGGGQTYTSSSFNCFGTTPLSVTNPIWSGPGLIQNSQSTSFTATPSSGGTYNFTANAPNGCPLSASVSFNMLTAPSPGLFPNTTATCEGAGVILTMDATDATNYVFSGPGGYYEVITSTDPFSVVTANITNDASAAMHSGQYTVVATNASGCSTTETVTIDVFPTPVVSEVSSSPETCPGYADGSFVVTSTGTAPFIYSAYDYNNTMFMFSSNGNFTNVGSGLYDMSVTDANGCFSDPNIPVSVNVGLVPNTAPTLTCPGPISVTSDAGVCGAIVLVEPVAFDSCPVGLSAISLINGVPSGGVFPVGVTTNEYIVYDAELASASCSVTITVTDNEAPNAVCQNITVQLDAAGNASITAAQIDNGSSDACGIQSMTVSPNTFTCANVGANTVTLTVTDNNGNVSTCTATVTVQDNVAPVALCQNITVQLNAAGNASITAAQIDNGSNDACGIQSLSVSPNTFTCANVGANTVTLTVTDNNGNVSTCTATVTVQDNVAPVALCQNITVQLDAAGNASITAAQINNGSNDACGIQSLSVSPNTFTCANVGPNTVTLTVTDNNGNVSTCTATVTVQDNVAPVALCQNITVQLDAAGNASITAAQINNGSNDACGIQSMTVAPNTFTCANVGANTVTLTVTDNNGNVSTCTATVTVQDNVAPVALCQNITVQLNAAGNASITAAQIDNGSSDACGIQSMTVSPNTFTCANVGANTVTLTVTDNNGNVSTCTATVTVQDNVAPVALCQNITVQLDAAGNASITAAQINNGSNDACGIQSLSVSPNTFTCANVGPNTVTLTVTDNNGNVSTCTATVTVQDNVAPVALCQNVTIYLDANGQASTTAAAVDNGSNDACGISSIVLSKTSFNCSNTGANPVVLTVTDVNGNVSTCNATVTVLDTIAPVISCNANISVNTDPGVCGAAVSYVVTGSDNCSYTITQTAGLTSGSVFPVGTTVNQFLITDASGNTATCSFEVIVTDNEFPVFVNFPSNSSQCNPVSWIQPTVSDNCPTPSRSYSYLGNTFVSLAGTVSHVFPSGTTTVTYTTVDANGNITTQSFNVTVLEPSTAADSISTSRDYNNICRGENITLTLWGGSLGEAASWKWYAGGCGAGAVVGTGTSITVAPLVTTTYYARAEGLCNTTSCVSVTVIVSTAAPSIAPTYSVLPAYGAPGITDVISVIPVPGATYYRWFTNNGQINGVQFNGQLSPVQTAAPTVNVTFVLSQQNYQIRVIAGNACGRGTQRNATIRGTVAATTCINGPTTYCPGQTLTYSACPIPSQTGNTSVSYQWSLIPANAGTITGNGLNATVVINPGFPSVQVCVAGVSSFGLVGQQYCIVASTSAPAPSVINGPLFVCEGASGVAYSTPAVNGASSYLWTSSIPGVTFSGNGENVTANFPAGPFSGTICVAAVSPTCGTSAPICINVNSDTPASIGSITGPINGVCLESNVNYSVGSGANSYVWTLPSGVTGSSTTNSINVNFGAGFTSGTISVTGNFACGSSSTSILVSGAPGTPQIPSGGVNSICLTDINQVYSVNATGATSYNWTVTGEDGIATCVNPPVCNQYTVEAWMAGASLSVVATNTCGSSAPYVFPVGCRFMDNRTFESSVFPNPTGGIITVAINSGVTGDYMIRVTDLSGRTIAHETIKVVDGVSAYTVDLSHVNKGMYLVEVKDLNGASKVTRLSVE